MILRRLTTALRKQDWFTVGIETLIVVLGVFLGIQLGNWNQYAGDRRSEAEYLRQLQGDLHNIQAEIDAQIEFEQFQARLAGEVYALIRNDTSEERALKIDIGLSQLLVRRTLRTQSPTFLNLQGSGKLDIISDPDLRAAIISYFYSTSRLAAAIDKNNAVFTDGAFVDFMMSEGIPPRGWDSGLMNKELPPAGQVSSAFKEKVWENPLYAAGGTGLDAPPDAEIWEKFIPRLAWRGNISTNNESLAQSLKTATEDLEAKLDARLERRAP
jgi:hypothetical protein